MEKLEQQLDDLLVKKAPFQIPENGRKGLVTAFPWLTLLGGLLMLWGAWALWQLVTWADQLTELSTYYGAGYVAPVAASPLLWVSLAVLLVEALLFFIAFPALRAHKKSGWNILFWVSLINVVQSVMQAIAYSNLGSIVMSLLGSVVGLYILFQVRSYYTGEKKMASASTTTPPAATPPTTPVAPTEKPIDTTDKKV